jgi:MFS family permease
MNKNKYRWLLLSLVVITYMLIYAIPTMAISVLSEEISLDLNLSVVQMGVVWGGAALLGIFTGLLGGAIIDKIGAKKIFIIGCLATGLLGAARGFAANFISLTVIVFLLGAFMPIILNSGYKISGMWFPSEKLGLANGIISMGMALGFLLGSFLSASVLSPLLGGWRNVLILYGVLSALLTIPWIFVRSIPEGITQTTQDESSSIFKKMMYVASKKNIWLIGLVYFGVGGGVQGILGYLPLHLRSIGWTPLAADGALSAFHFSSLIFVLPIAFWSDRLGARKRILMITGIMSAVGALVISITNGGLVWAGIFLAGMVRDGFMTILLTMIVESEGIGHKYVGTATGFVLAIGGISSFLAPPIGNSLVSLWGGAPFLFWSILSFAGIFCLKFVSTKHYQSDNTKISMLVTQK